MPGHRSPRTPRTPRRSAPSQADIIQLCEITAHRILRKGFIIEYLKPMTSIQVGLENDTGVALVVSAGRKSVRDIRHTDPGITDGILDIASQGHFP
ncbi:hypothetical protein F4679DRAFT_582511 [Xylaria curta]|nr:hypothetical protein F4679DRAFT_582511 [Xylaria curta]